MLEEGNQVRQLRDFVSKFRSFMNLDSRYVECVPLDVRTLAGANHLPKPNRYVPAAESYAPTSELRHT